MLARLLWCKRRCCLRKRFLSEVSPQTSSKDKNLPTSNQTEPCQEISPIRSPNSISGAGSEFVRFDIQDDTQSSQLAKRNLNFPPQRGVYSDNLERASSRPPEADQVFAKVRASSRCADSFLRKSQPVLEIPHSQLSDLPLDALGPGEIQKPNKALPTQFGCRKSETTPMALLYPNYSRLTVEPRVGRTLFEKTTEPRGTSSQRSLINFSSSQQTSPRSHRSLFGLGSDESCPWSSNFDLSPDEGSLALDDSTHSVQHKSSTPMSGELQPKPFLINFDENTSEGNRHNIFTKTQSIEDSKNSLLAPSLREELKLGSGLSPRAEDSKQNKKSQVKSSIRKGFFINNRKYPYCFIQNQTKKKRIFTKISTDRENKPAACQDKIPEGEDKSQEQKPGVTKVLIGLQGNVLSSIVEGNDEDHDPEPSIKRNAEQKSKFSVQMARENTEKKASRRSSQSATQLNGSRSVDQHNKRGLGQPPRVPVKGNLDKGTRPKLDVMGNYIVSKNRPRGEPELESLSLVFDKDDPKKELLAMRKLMGMRVGRAQDGETVRKNLELGQAQLKELSHPNILKFIAVVEDLERERLFMVTELATGAVSLQSWLSLKEPMSQEQAYHIFCQALSGLVYCHSKGVAHGDLNASSILITSGNTLKIKKIGLNSLLQPFTRQLQTDLESSYYLPPEALSANSDPFLGDAWALGVLLFRLVVGQYPFQANNVASLLTAITNERVHIPLSVNGVSLSAALRDLLFRLLQKNPDARPTLLMVTKHNWVTCNGTAAPLAWQRASSIGKHPLPPAVRQFSTAPP